MKSFLAVFTTATKYCWRDLTSVAVLIAFPIMLILVLGNALAGFISPTYDFEPLPVSASVEAGGNLETFLQSGESSQFMEINFTTRENAEELVQSGEVYVAIIEEDGEVTVIRARNSGMNAMIPISIIDSYKQIGAAMTIAMTSGGDFTELAGLIGAELSVTAAPLGNRVQSAIDYYAVTMLVMILLFTGLNGLELFKKSMFSETGARVLTSPVSKPVLVGGLLAAATVTSYVQGLITFFFTMFVYGVYWGENIPLVLLTLFAVTLFSQAFAIVVLLLCKSPNAAMGVMQALIWVMTFVAGGYVKIDFGAAQEIFRYSPNSLAHTIIFGSAFGGNETRMMNDLALLFIYVAVLFVIAFILGKRRLTK
ncbi:MAG: ABC transporter permease [Oscillospiraceae bacterium]|nr:ABC transporter permease [Oscillospiraceae bacterium]